MNNAQKSTAKDGNAQNQTTDQSSPKDNWQDHIAKVLDYTEQLKDDYKTQGALSHQLAKAEWHLSLRSLVLITIFLGCFASGLVLLWAGFLSMIGYAVFNLFGSIWLSILTAMLLQVACLIGLWKNTVYLSKKIGFSKTFQSLKLLFNL